MFLSFSLRLFSTSLFVIGATNSSGNARLNALDSDLDKFSVNQISGTTSYQENAKQQDDVLFLLFSRKSINSDYMRASSCVLLCLEIVANFQKPLVAVKNIEFCYMVFCVSLDLF
jgi:hypothetical protein